MRSTSAVLSQAAQQQKSSSMRGTVVTVSSHYQTAAATNPNQTKAETGSVTGSGPRFESSFGLRQ